MYLEKQKEERKQEEEAKRRKEEEEKAGFNAEMNRYKKICADRLQAIEAKYQIVPLLLTSLTE